MKTSFLSFILLAFIMIACTQSQTQQDSQASPAEVRTANVEMRDFGPEPFVLDMEAYTLQNENYRTTIWTGVYMQMTVMNILPGEDIGLEIHDDRDQFIRVEQGSGLVQMGDSQNSLDFEKRLEEDFAVFIPAGKWHNVINDTDKPLKLYSIYSPPEHPHGAVHKTQQEGIEAHAHEH